jgi:hypothetical protein
MIGFAEFEVRRRGWSGAAAEMLFVVPLLAAAPPANPVRGFGAHLRERNASATGSYMDCGSAYLCGVLTLQTGLGPGAYGAPQPSAHGLWPEVGSYGNSPCIAPSGSTANPTTTYSCYQDGTGESQVSFETHEWTKHGECAGVINANDFFTQLCSMASGPLAVMTSTRSAGSTSRERSQAPALSSTRPLLCCCLSLTSSCRCAQ